MQRLATNKESDLVWLRNEFQKIPLDLQLPLASLALCRATNASFPNFPTRLRGGSKKHKLKPRTDSKESTLQKKRRHQDDSAISSSSSPPPKKKTHSTHRHASTSRQPSAQSDEGDTSNKATFTKSRTRRDPTSISSHGDTTPQQPPPSNARSPLRKHPNPSPSSSSSLDSGPASFQGPSIDAGPLSDNSATAAFFGNRDGDATPAAAGSAGWAAVCAGKTNAREILGLPPPGQFRRYNFPRKNKNGTNTTASETRGGGVGGGEARVPAGSDSADGGALDKALASSTLESEGGGPGTGKDSDAGGEGGLPDDPSSLVAEMARLEGRGPRGKSEDQNAAPGGGGGGRHKVKNWGDEVEVDENEEGESCETVISTTEADKIDPIFLPPKILGPGWTRADDEQAMAQGDPELMDPVKAGRRGISEELLIKLLDDLPLSYRLVNDSSCLPPRRFFNCPKVLIEGENPYLLRDRLPYGAAVAVAVAVEVVVGIILPEVILDELDKVVDRGGSGYSLRKLTDTAAFLVRVMSPPPEWVESEGSGRDAYADSELVQSSGNAGIMDRKAQTGKIEPNKYNEWVRTLRMPRLMRRVQQLGDVDAKFEIGRKKGQTRYLHGNGTKRDPVKGCRWLMDAGAQGDCYAQVEVGRCYEQGIGVPADAAQAMRWYKLAARGSGLLPEGLPSAEHNVAVLYSLGAPGVRRDAVLACAWYKRAAKRGFSWSQHNLANHYALGSGVRRHERKAAFWYLQAALQGSSHAQLEIGLRYVKGLGVAKDQVKASKWLRKAARNGEADAVGLLKAMEQGSEAVAEFLQALAAAEGPSPGERALERSELGSAFVHAHQDLADQLAHEAASAREAALVSANRTVAAGALAPRLSLRREAEVAEAQAEALRVLSERGQPMRVLEEVRRRAEEGGSSDKDEEEGEED